MNIKTTAVAAVKIAIGHAAAESQRAKEPIDKYRETLVAMRDAVDSAIKRCDDEIAERAESRRE